MSTRTSKLLATTGLVILGGCGAPRFVEAPAPPEPPAAAPRADSLFDPGRFRALAADRRAAGVGDVLIVTLVERTSASSTARQSAERSGNLGVRLPRGLSTDASGALTYEGAGSVTRSTRLDGEIAVTVTGVRANGLLEISGERRLRLPSGEEQVRLTGLVRPEDVRPDNRVPSTRVADARISQLGRGALADAERPGWLSRFFSRWSPF